MNRFFTLNTLWQTLRESDLRPLRDQALRGMDIAIVGNPGTGRSVLADQMRRDPNHPQQISTAPFRILDLDTADQAASADLIILLVQESHADLSRAQELVRQWQESGKRVLVFIIPQIQPDSQAISPWTNRTHRRVLIGSPYDTRFMVEKFAPAVIEIVPDRLLALGRYYPLFRLPIARFLINDTSFSNAAYAMSTGLAEIVAVLDIPITIADTVVLTKAQAFLVYKLGLALGYSTRWQDYIGEFGGVLGSGFVWRQIARSLVGLIPVWGIVPKTAIAYSGTFVVGNVVLQWYLTGKHVSKKQMQIIYNQALEHGRALAHSLFARLPHPRFKLRLPQVKLPRLGRSQPKSALPAPGKRSLAKPGQVCQSCGKVSALDAAFCQYCGTSFVKT